MKKIFTLLLVVATALAAQATDYDVPMSISVNDVTSEQRSVISITENEGLYDFYLKNFILQSSDGPMGVGNVELKGIKPVNVDGATFLIAFEKVTITQGDDPDVQVWLADYLPPVAVDLYAKIVGDKLRCCIDIDLTDVLQQFIHVEMGEGYQLPNRSFEYWHTSTGSYVEPDGWHSFESATGALASMAGHHISKSDDAHTGEASARIFATSIFGIVANGTMTTGRMNAGNMSASNKANHAYLDLSDTATDGAGKPFSIPMYTCPDSIVFWAKFKQGTPNASHPYATVSAVITDGTRYQDPEDKVYTNVVAKAQNKQIATTGSEWKRISAPFVKTENNVNPKAILITISTNADPGQGSANDEVLVDDISFIYNSKVTDIQIKGESVKDFDPDTHLYEITMSEVPALDDVTATANSETAVVISDIIYDEDLSGYILKVLAINGDLSERTPYNVIIKTTVTDVQAPQSAANETVTYYTFDGIQVTTPQAGKIYLARKSDGTVTKILK